MKQSLVAITMAGLLSTNSFGADLTTQQQIDSLKQQLESLVLSLEEEKETKQNSSLLGDKVSFGGYGKVDYVNYRDKDNADTFDNYRLVFYTGYQFSDSVSLHTEVEFEHGTNGEVEIEQNYIDWKLTDTLALSMGTMLVPVGYVNLYHEPTVFNSVNRPETEKYIIPSTWHENGITLRGSAGNLDYKLGAFASLNGADGSEIRSMRQKGNKSSANDFAFVGRVDYHALNDTLLLGGSYYSGNVDQGDSSLEGVGVDMMEVHAVYKYNALELTGLYAKNDISNADKLAVKNAANSSGKSSGYYINAAYSIDKFTPFVRYEQYNRFEEKYTATTGAKTNADADVKIIATGINYNIDENVVLKADYLTYDNKGTDDDRAEIGVGFTF